MNKYQRAKIYKIVSNAVPDVYIGSTCEPYLSNRLAGHRGNYKRYLNGKSPCCSSYKILGTNDYDIILIEQYPCNNKEELHARERYWIEITKNCVNKRSPEDSWGLERVLQTKQR